MVVTAFVVLGTFLAVAGALGVLKADVVGPMVVSVDPFEGEHPGGDDPVAWATAVARWVSGAVVLLGVGLFGAGVLG